MEWPQELIAIFNDPLLANVKAPSAPITADDRTQKKLAEVKEWITANGREPQRDGKDLKEKLMSVSLETLRKMGLWT